MQEILNYSKELQNSVRLVGPISDDEKVDFYNLAEVYILPSKFEGFGIVFIEALSCGVPVIASNAYGCPEGLMHGKLGTLVDPDDSDSIAKAIISNLSKNPTRAMLALRL